MESLVQLPLELLAGATKWEAGKLIVGVDGGGTKTLAAAWDPATAEVWLGLAGPSNLDSAGEKAAEHALRHAVEEASTAARPRSEPIAPARFGLAGAGTAPACPL